MVLFASKRVMFKAKRWVPLLVLSQRDHLLSLTKESGQDLLGTSKGHEVSTGGLWGLGLHGGFPHRGSRWAKGRDQGGRKKRARETEDGLPDLPRRLWWASPPHTRLSQHLPLAWYQLLSPLWPYPASTVSVREWTVHLPETRVGPDFLCKEACVFSCHCCPGAHFFPATAAQDGTTSHVSPALCWWLEGQGHVGREVPRRNERPTYLGMGKFCSQREAVAFQELWRRSGRISNNRLRTMSRQPAPEKLSFY